MKIVLLQARNFNLTYNSTLHLIGDLLNLPQNKNVFQLTPCILHGLHSFMTNFQKVRSTFFPSKSQRDFAYNLVRKKLFRLEKLNPKLYFRTARGEVFLKCKMPSLREKTALSCRLPHLICA